MALTLTGLKILAIFIVFLAGLIGPACPVIFSYFARGAKNQRRVQKTIKVMTCLAIGIILATALIHMLHEGTHLLAESGKLGSSAPESEEQEKTIVINNCSGNITTPSPETNKKTEDSEMYPFGMLFALIGIGIVYMFSTELNFYGMKKLKEIENIYCDEEEEQRQASIIKLYILEVGIAVHSIIIGVTLGLTDERGTATTLFIVLCIHQAFEGLSIGSLCIMSLLTVKQCLFFIFSFAITTPLGIVIGLGVSGDADKLTQGILSCMSAGLLLEMALTEMLGSVFGAHGHSHSHGPLDLDKIADHMHNHQGGHGHSHGAQDGGHHHHHHSENEVLNTSNVKTNDKEQHDVGYGTVESHQQQQQQTVDVARKGSNVGSAVAGSEENEEDCEYCDKGIKIGKGAYKKVLALRQSQTQQQHEHNDNEDDKQHEAVESASTGLLLEPADPMRASVAISDYVDDHGDDESFGFRCVCYLALFVGMSIQAVLGIWA